MARATDQECIRAGILRAGIGSSSSETPASIAAYEQAWDRYHRTAGFGDIDPPEVVNLAGTEVVLSSPFAPYGQPAEVAPAPAPAPAPASASALASPWVWLAAAGVAVAIYLAMGDDDGGGLADWDEDDLGDEEEDEDALEDED